MDKAERRNEIMKLLKGAHSPLSASFLAGKMHVSRQIIVGDIALLRAANENILSTPRGYLLEKPEESGIRQKIACRHTKEQIKEELYAIVDEGCTVLDVIVEHPLYGQLSGLLQISSRHDVDIYLKKCENANAAPLSSLTDGLHLHTILAPDSESLFRVQETLKEKHFLEC